MDLAFIVEASLCEAATIRGGLMNILSGGITQVTRAQYPAPLGLMLAVWITAGADALETPRKLSMSLNRDGERHLARIEVDLAVRQRSETRIRGEQITVPLIMSLVDPVLPGPGLYLLDLSVDGIVERQLRLVAQ